LHFVKAIIAGRVLEGKEQQGQLIDSSGIRHPLNNAAFLPPSNPTKIIGLALNYRDHATELGMNVAEDPVLFLKPPSSLIGNRENIVYPKGAKYVHYEGELCAVIGTKAKKVDASQAMEYTGGFTIANDVTVRDYITNTFRPPVKAKGFDTFCPAGPYLVTPDEAGDVSNLRIRTLVNGEVKQDDTTASLMHPVPKLIEYLSSFMTLFPGDMILTGTPKGISPVRPGDKIEVEIENLGKLENYVVEEKK
jgi:5-oxopent-3-ene-1,2,5-tricarboxylate decarboxylase / 2-hydroxyhepta-2,4-diene-1,7-dioate isomerase